MTIEIKQGDKVRVSKDAPKLYTDGWRFDWRNLDSVVGILEGDDATITPTDVGEEELSIPTKYLVKVEDEAKEPKFKVGDKVVRKNVSTVRTIISIDYVDDDEDPAYYYNTVDSQGNNPMDFLESELILYIESTPKYKKGDRVKFKNIYELQKVKDKSFRWMLVMFASKEATITEVEDNGFYRVDIDPSIGGINDDMIECKVEPTAQTEAEKSFEDQLRDVLNGVGHQDYGHPIQSAMISLDINYWDAYTADLAKEIALKVANKYNDPEQAAEYAVKVAKAVVEGLKRK